MMSIDTMLKEIERASEEEAKSIIEEAEKKAKQIVEDAKRKVEEIRKRKLDEKKKELENKMAVMTAFAKLEGRKEYLLAKKNILEEVFKRFEERVTEAVKNQDINSKLLKKMLNEALENLDGEEFIVHSNRRDMDLLKKILREVEKEISKNRNIKLRLSQEPVDIKGGVIVERADGRQIFNNALEAKLIRVRQEFESEVYRMLFEGV